VHHRQAIGPLYGHGTGRVEGPLGIKRQDLGNANIALSVSVLGTSRLLLDPGCHMVSSSHWL